MTYYFKILLSLAIVSGLSAAENAKADFRDYNHKAWAQVGRQTSRSVRRSRPAYRAVAPVIVRTDSTPPVVAQAPAERRSFSYEPSQQEPAPATAERPTRIERRFSYEPSLDATGMEPAVRTYSVPRMRTSRPSDTPRYLLPKTDPRKYRN